MIIFKNVTLRRGASILMENIEWSIFPGQRIGLVGANGAGKSSLFAMLQGQLEPDRGDVSLPKQWKIAHLEQETPGTSQTALAYVLDGDAEYCRIDAALTEAELAGDGFYATITHEKTKSPLSPERRLCL